MASTMRSDEKSSYWLPFILNPNNGIVSLGNTDIKGVTGLSKTNRVPTSFSRMISWMYVLMEGAVL
jgi:hypothetical protein